VDVQKATSFADFLAFRVSFDPNMGDGYNWDDIPVSSGVVGDRAAKAQEMSGFYVATSTKEDAVSLLEYLGITPMTSDSVVMPLVSVMKKRTPESRYRSAFFSATTMSVYAFPYNTDLSAVLSGPGIANRGSSLTSKSFVYKSDNYGRVMCVSP
jgi:hypothetical protein